MFNIYGVFAKGWNEVAFHKTVIFQHFKHISNSHYILGDLIHLFLGSHIFVLFDPVYTVMAAPHPHIMACCDLTGRYSTALLTAARGRLLYWYMFCSQAPTPL